MRVTTVSVRTVAVIDAMRKVARQPTDAVVASSLAQTLALSRSRRGVGSLLELFELVYACPTVSAKHRKINPGSWLLAFQPECRLCREKK